MFSPFTEFAEFSKTYLGKKPGLSRLAAFVDVNWSLSWDVCESHSEQLCSTRYPDKNSSISSCERFRDKFKSVAIKDHVRSNLLPVM